MASVRTSTDGDPTGEERKPGTADDAPVDAEGLVELLGDENTRSVLEAITDEALAVKEIAAAASLSTPTVYRRLARLEEAGLVASRLAVCADGHHHEQYRAVLDSASFRLGPDGLTASVRTEPTDGRPEARLD